MEILLAFENLRNPVLNKIFTYLTFFGEETFMILLICLFAWCINKDIAQKLGYVFSYSLAVNQIVKITLCIPRPWLRFNTTPYEPALERASGYSFPSGHTQTSSTIYVGAADYYKKKKYYILAVAFSLLIGISRVYFGVHTLTDVLAGFVIGVVCVFAFGSIYEKYTEKPKYLLICGAVFTAIFILYTALKKYPQDVELKLISDCYKLGGLMSGYFIALYLEKMYLNYSVKGSIITQIIKYIAGVLVLFIIKTLFESCAPSYLIYFAEYFVLVFWCVYLYPLIFSKIK